MANDPFKPRYSVGLGYILCKKGAEVPPAVCAGLGTVAYYSTVPVWKNGVVCGMQQVPAEKIKAFCDAVEEVTGQRPREVRIELPSDEITYH